MNNNEFVLDNLDTYKAEIIDKLDALKNLRTTKTDNIEYFGSAYHEVERLYSLIHDIEDAFSINQLLSKTYSYTVAVKGTLNEIFLPVGNAGTLLTSLQRSLRVFDNNVRLNLVNVLRGSTILCFDYSQNNYDNKNLNRVDISSKFNQLAEILSKNEDDVKDEVIELFDRNKKTAESAVRAFKGLTPIPGSETEICINTEFGGFDSLVIGEDVRRSVNKVVPPSGKKDSRVNWEDKVAIGYIREINNVSKSFLLFENDQVTDENSSLIKLHYETGTTEKTVLDLFRKKATIEFDKVPSRNKYIVKTIR